MTHTPPEHGKERAAGPGGEAGPAPEKDSGPSTPLPSAAKRALAEAEERRRQADTARHDRPPREIGGRGGKDPVRYGDWEIKGRAIDF